MGINVSFDVEELNKQLEAELDKVRECVADVGREAVTYAKENGTYRNRTGRLRRSNTFQVADDCSLSLVNTAPYAADVEARGHDVLSGAALFAAEQLNELFK